MTDGATPTSYFVNVCSQVSLKQCCMSIKCQIGTHKAKCCEYTTRANLNQYRCMLIIRGAKLLIFLGYLIPRPTIFINQGFKPIPVRHTRAKLVLRESILCYRIMTRGSGQEERPLKKGTDDIGGLEYPLPYPALARVFPFSDKPQIEFIEYATQFNSYPHL